MINPGQVKSLEQAAHVTLHYLREYPGPTVGVLVAGAIGQQNHLDTAGLLVLAIIGLLIGMFAQAWLEEKQKA